MKKRIIAIGDVQGCYDTLMRLLNDLRYDEHADQLWFTGDLINRGTQSLQVLRFVKNLREHAVTVLGNHDLHCLAVAVGAQTQKSKDTLDDILNAHDRDELLFWLRQQPLLYRHHNPNYIMTHAGVYPDWDVDKAEQLAREAETTIRGENHIAFFRHMYGNQPEQWRDDLSGWERTRFIVNSYTRMRFVDNNAGLELKHKGPPGSQPKHLMPWYMWPSRRSLGMPIIFGHWSALGLHSQHDVYCLDTGCLWGGSLSALIIDQTARHFSIKCPEYLSSH